MKILVKTNTKTGYTEAHEFDSINLEHPNSTTRRGRVGRRVAQTITTSPQQAVVEPVNAMDDGTSRTIKNQYYKTSAANFGRSTTFGATGVRCGVRIRKFTPRECMRLMGFTDKDVDKLIAAGISNTQIYKLAGNSIVVPMLEFLDCQIFDSENEIWV